MPDKLLLHTIWFRLLVPAIMGLIAYIVILMYSDRLVELPNIFFGAELFILIITSYLVFAAIRLTIIIFFGLPQGDELEVRKIGIQVAVTIFIGCLVSMFPLTIYMKFFLGYTNFAKELVMFVVLFGFIGVFYNLLYFSLYFLNLRNTSALEHENQLHNSLTKEFKGFLRDIHPEFFYSSLETLIVLLRQDRNKADKFIKKFSNVFRYIIDCKKKEIATISEELTHLNDLIYIFNQKFGGQIKLETNVNKDFYGFSVVPCTVQCLLEQTVLSSVISADRALIIQLSSENQELVFKHNGLERIKTQVNSMDLKYLSDTHKYFTGKPIMAERNKDEMSYRIPLFTENIEPLE